MLHMYRNGIDLYSPCMLNNVMTLASSLAVGNRTEL